MPYTIRTKDGILVKDIPDELAPDSPQVKGIVEQIRTTQNRPKEMNPGVQQANLANPAPPLVEEPKTTAGGVLAQVNRALIPAAAATAAGAGLGSIGGGVGAVPGAIAGLGAYSLARTTADPIVGVVNHLFGTQYEMPTQALEHLLTKLGMPEPKTEAERIVGAASQAGVSAAGMVGAGSALSAPGFSQTTQGVGSSLASQPAAQIASGTAAGAAAQGAKEAGYGPGVQFAAGLGGSLVGGAPFVKGSLKTPPELAGIEEAAAPAAARTAESSAVPMAETIAPKVAANAIEPTPQVVGELVRKASGSGMGSTAAKNQLAEMAAVNTEAKNAAERLGIELPADVFSDSPQIRAAAGLTRSAAGSPAEAAWRTSVTNAVDKADEVIKGFDATFAEGQVSPGVVSEKVRNTLQNTRSEMNAAAQKIYNHVDSVVPKSAPVKASKLEESLVKTMDEVGAEGMSAQEKRLLKMVDSPNGITYGRLIREKNLIGQALAGKDSPYGNMEAASLKRLYGALAEDQLGAVEAVGGSELRQQLHGANLIYAKERALGKRIVDAFGEDFDGSLAKVMRSAVAEGSKGGSAEFSKLMKVVPDDLKKEVVATALASATRSARGAMAGGFGFSEFAKTYQGLRANAPVYKQVVDALGDGSHEILRDLYEVSKRITDARANVLTTGKANQALSQAMTAESLVSKVLGSTASKAVATGASAVGAGPAGAAASTVIMNALSGGRKDALRAAGELFHSEEFQKLLVEAATQVKVRPTVVNVLVNGQAFRRFAQVVQLPKSPDQRARWVMDAVRAENSTIQ